MPPTFVEALQFCFTNQWFYVVFTVSSIFWIATWMIIQLGYHKKMEFVGMSTSLIHSTLSSLVSLYLVLTFSREQMETIPKDDEEAIPELWKMYRFLLIFSSSYFVVDGVQFIFFRQDKSFGFRVIMIIHHALICLIEFSLYHFHPFMVYLFSWALVMELATIFMNLRYFGKQFRNKYVYAIGGGGTLILYPFLRVPIALHIVNVGWTGIVPFCDDNIWIWGLITSIFVFGMSVYYTFAVIWRNPKKMCLLKLKEKST